MATTNWIGKTVHTKSALGRSTLKGVVRRAQEFPSELSLVVRCKVDYWPGTEVTRAGLDEAKYIDDGEGNQVYLMPGEIFRSPDELWECNGSGCDTCAEMREERWT